MANVLDVAKYILEETGSTSTWKLQKLVYYSQAWHLVWHDTLLFPESIKAWANGPVCPSLYAQHKGMFSISANDLAGFSDRLTETEKDTISKVVTFYGNYSGQQLSDITHQEAPWLKARAELSFEERGNEEITPESMAEFYSSLPVQ